MVGPGDAAAGAQGRLSGRGLVDLGLVYGAVVTDGVPRFVGRSRNTPAPMKTVRVAECRIPQDFSLSSH